MENDNNNFLNLEREDGATSAKNVEADEKTKEAIKAIDSRIFPGDLALPPEVVDAYLSNPKGVITVLSIGEIVVGYVAGDPLNDAYNDLHAEDPELENFPETIYVESIAILPENRNLENYNKLISTFKHGAKQKGFRLIAMHTRTSNGLSDVLQKRYGAKFWRRIENWFGFGEPFDFLTLDLNP